MGPSPESRANELDAAVRRARARRSGSLHGRTVGAQLALIGGLGWTILAPVFLGLAVGWVLDQWRGFGGAFRVLLMALGALAGLLLAWRMMQRASDQPHDDDAVTGEKTTKQEPPP
jgi:ATP synthase protein I